MKTKLNQSKLKLAIVSATLLGAAAITAPTYAEISYPTSDMDVTASINVACTIESEDLAFGAYDPIITNASAPLQKMASVTSTCTVGAEGSILFSNGNNYTEETGRRMVSAVDATKFLEYSISNASYGGANWSGVAMSGTGSAVKEDVYGEVDAGQTAAVDGSYSDLIVATVTY